MGSFTTASTMRHDPGGRAPSCAPLRALGLDRKLSGARQSPEQEKRMRSHLCNRMAVGAIGALLVALAGSAQAMTCSERLQVCQGYCAKSMGDTPGCHAKCRQFHQECMASGCWESKVVAKQCGFAPQ